MKQLVAFISYSHKDEAEKEALLSHLGVLHNHGLIDLWSDDRIRAGSDWQREIQEAIAQAKVAILLISANFLTSDFILSKEVPSLLKRRNDEGLTIFPVIAKPCVWKRVEWLTQMNVRPKNGSPVWREAGRHADDDLAAIAEEVAEIIETAIKLSGPSKIRVLIADDHVHEREGFKQLMTLTDDIEVIDEATSAQECSYKALNLKPDVVLLDLKWYNDRTAGISAIRRIKTEAPQIKIVAVTAFDELIEEARRAGAELAADKNSLYDGPTIAALIRDAYNSPAFPKPLPPLIEELSERELEVLMLVAQGKSDKDIAEQLEIAVSTVKKHVSVILGKLEVQNRAGAVAEAYERGMIIRRPSEL